MPRTPETWVSVPVQLLTASYTRIGYPALVFPSQELQIFHPKILIFDPLDPKFDPKTCTLVYKHQKAFDRTTNSQHQISQKSSLCSFLPNTHNFLIFHSNFINNHTN